MHGVLAVAPTMVGGTYFGLEADVMGTVWAYAGDNADEALDDLEAAIEVASRPDASFMARWLMQHRTTGAVYLVAGLWGDVSPDGEGKVEARRRVDRLRIYLMAAGEWDGDSGYGIDDIDAIRVAYQALV